MAENRRYSGSLLGRATALRDFQNWELLDLKKWWVLKLFWILIQRNKCCKITCMCKRIWETEVIKQN